jgi:hypothetical protein
MVSKRASAIAIGAALLMWSCASVAGGYPPDEYQPGEFLGLDLSKAVLSPKPLGPPAQFRPLPIQAQTDPATSAAPAISAAPARAKPKAVSEAAVAKPAIPRPGIARSSVRKPRDAGRNRLARRHGNPLDAEAFDRRIQIWPCRSGGICNWQPH